MKIGDRVKVINLFSHQDLEGKTGRIVDLSSYKSQVGVEFDENICGHSCNGYCKNGYGRYGFEEELKLISIINVRKLNKQIYDFRTKVEKKKRDKNVTNS